MLGLGSSYEFVHFSLRRCRFLAPVFVFKLANDSLVRQTMMSSAESISTFNARPIPDCSRDARLTPAPRKLSAYTAAVVARLRDLAPYAVIELVLPGGSLMALLLWLYRRQKKVL